MCEFYDRIEIERPEFNVYFDGDLALLDNEDDTIIYNLPTKKYETGRIDVDNQEEGMINYHGKREPTLLSQDATAFIRDNEFSKQQISRNVFVTEVEYNEPRQFGTGLLLRYVEGAARVSLSEAITSTRAVWYTHYVSNLLRHAAGGRISCEELRKFPKIWRVTIDGQYRDLFVAHDEPQVICHQQHYYIFVALWDGRVEIYRTPREI